jgi:hypothetical protein
MSQVDNEDSDAEEDNVAAFQHCQNKQKARHRTTIRPEKLKTRLDPDQAAMPIAMGNSATSAKSRATDRKNVGRELKKISPAETGKDVPFGQKCM